MRQLSRLPTQPFFLLIFTFYRARKKAIKQDVKDRATQVLFSSQSVVISDDHQLADRISELAKIFDASASHVYAISEMELVSGFDKQKAL
jgi:hypothetical protein